MTTGHPAIQRAETHGTWIQQAEQQIDTKRAKEELERMRAFGLEPAESIRDRNITLFNRVPVGYGHFGPFNPARFLEDMRELGGQDVVFIGAPYDGGTGFRSGARYGPQGMRSMSGMQRGFLPDFGVDLKESLTMVDAGDVTVIPGNLEKSFDQIAKALSYAAERAVFPVVLGGDHSIGYPDVRGIAPYIDGNIGIIHFDRHADTAEYGLDERSHGTPFFHATNIPNAPPANLVQIGIGRSTGPRPMVRNARERGTTFITMRDVERFGLDRVVEYALEVAWHNAKAVWISLDIDVVDPAFAPGTGSPVPGGFTSREILRLVSDVAKEGILGMEVVEVAPPYDSSDVTSLLGAWAILEVLGTLVQARKLGRVL
ncbi:MAG: agmatinase [Chloroflexi bacterium]|nr:MAG: agmatinase [Chloroflexota bacterium]